MKRKSAEKITERAIKCTLTSVLTLLLDLSLLYLLVEKADVRYLLAAGIAFWIAHTEHYVLDRVWSFRGTKADKYKGYANFLIVGIVGGLTILAVVKVGVEYFDLGYMVARLIASVFGGILIFILNYTLTFKMGSELKDLLK